MRRQGLVERDPSVGVTGPKLEQRLPTHLLAPEVEAFLMAPDRSEPRGMRDAAILECLYSSGMRVSEVVSLNLDDLPEHGDSLRVVGKGRKERMVFLGRAAREALSEYLWQFTRYNNFGSAVLDSRTATSAVSLSHTLVIADLARGGQSATCDRIDVISWRHTVDTNTGALTLDVETLWSFGAKESAGTASLCN